MASSGSLVPAMDLDAGEGAGDGAGTLAADWTWSGDEGVAGVVIGVLGEEGVTEAEDTTVAGTAGEPLLFSGVEDLRGSLALSKEMGEDVRLWTILAGVLALLGLALGVEGLPRAAWGLGLGEPAGLGDVVLPLGVPGEEGRLDKGLGLGSGLCLILGRDCLFFNTFSLVRAIFSFSFSRSLSFFSFLFLSRGAELRLCWRCVMSGVLEVTLQRSEQR